MGLFSKKRKLEAQLIEQAFEAYNEAVDQFHADGGSNINCKCPVCGVNLLFSPYDNKNNRIKKQGIVHCANCDHYIEFALIDHNNDFRILLRDYHHYEDSHIAEKFNNYLANKVSVEDWKIIFDNDLDNPTLHDNDIKIKKILEDKGWLD